MKIMVFTEGTIFSHSNWLGLPREEIVQRVKDGERPDYAGTIPIGNAAQKIQAWRNVGAEILYLTSRCSPDEVEQAWQILQRCGFPEGQLLFRLEEEEYKDVAERAQPDILIEDDCESIGGEIEMTYPHIRPEIKAGIISIVVKEFGGIDHLPDTLTELFSR
ncbi:MAG: hypothetical protein EHM33_06370 [Chloroflexi bacterium]|nr:MAG: hypothetical protein EHM33_06370 [Chloroflexota bacterium]